MTTATVRFRYPLAKNALHIDYLRLRCGREPAFSSRIANDFREDVGAYIAFSEWDVVLFIPTDELYPEKLITIYSNPDLTAAIAGSAGYFTYVWDHPINERWEARLLERVGPTSNAHMSMLVSLRFTDYYRSRYGLGAELMFLNVLARALNESKFRGVTAVVAHGLGWNDATIMLKANEGSEDQLLDILTNIRYCTLADCLEREPRADDPAIIAATYSHLLGDLDLYAKSELRFGKLGDRVDRARMLVRVNPTVEKQLRNTLKDQFRAHQIEDEGKLGSELGHYNFSADLTDAFHRGAADPVRIIEGFRIKIDEFIRENETASTSFSETTTEITLRETLTAPGALPGVVESRLQQKYLKKMQDLLKVPARLEHRASKMTRHRLAILIGTIATYLDDPVRGSVVDHLCRFLDTEFERILETADRAGQEDLCHILEYALHQATDGLGQFQHDANALGLSGRGGYSRIIQAVDRYLTELVASFDLDLTPLLTFGLRPSHEGATVDYWIDIPFSMVFLPARWYVVYHEIAHMCWLHIFGWRLDSYEVWSDFAGTAVDIRKPLDPLQQKEFVQVRDIVDELFPNYVMLNLVTPGDLDRLDELMIRRELITKQRPMLLRTLFIRMASRALLDLHEQRRPKLDAATIDMFRKAEQIAGHEDASVDAKIQDASVSASSGWWNTWGTMQKELESPDGAIQEKIASDLEFSIERAARNLRRIIDDLESEGSFEGHEVMYGSKSIGTLVADAEFKDDAIRAVRHGVRLLARRQADYEERLLQKTSFDGEDPSAVQFGYVLGKIESMRDTAETTVREWMPGYANEIQNGTVLADGPGETAVSCFLADHRVTWKKPLVPSLSAILSFWHVAVTEVAHAQEDTPREEPLLELLRKRGVVIPFTFG